MMWSERSSKRGDLALTARSGISGCVFHLWQEWAFTEARLQIYSNDMTSEMTFNSASEDMCLLTKPDEQYKTLGREFTSERKRECSMLCETHLKRADLAEDMPEEARCAMPLSPLIFLADNVHGAQWIMRFTVMSSKNLYIYLIYPKTKEKMYLSNR